jgi:hypothetical protein
MPVGGVKAAHGEGGAVAVVLGEEGARGAGCHSRLLPPSIAKSLSIDDMETDATVVITRSHIAIILATNSALSALSLQEERTILTY